MQALTSQKPNVTVFDLPESIAKMSTAEMALKLTSTAFVDIPKESATIDSMTGWVDPFHPSQPFDGNASTSLGAYVVLSMRCDEYKYDKATVDMLAEKYCIENHMDIAWQQMKRGQMKQDVIDHVRRIIRTQTIPKTKAVVAVIDYSTSQILLMSKSSADAGAFMTLFANTFGVDLAPHNYNLEFVPPSSHVKILMRHLYTEAHTGAEYTGSRLDTSIFIRDYYGTKMQGVAEANLGTEYRVKTGNNTVDAVASELIRLGAADLVELGFTIESQWGEISFFVNDEKLVPYQIDIPNIGKVDPEELAQERIAVVIWLLAAWRDVLEGAVLTLAEKTKAEAEDIASGKVAKSDAVVNITVSSDGKVATVSADKLDKETATLKKGAGKKKGEQK